MDSKEWKELKNVISSLLISSPLQLTMRALNNDYRNEIGCNIQYEKFGFRTLEQCLDNMTDVLERNGNFISVCVSSKTAHIDKLVSRQVIPSSKRTRNPSSQRKHHRRHTTYQDNNPSVDYNFKRSQPNLIPPLIPLSRVLMPPPSEFMQKLFSQPMYQRSTEPQRFVPKTPQPQRKIYTNTPFESTGQYKTNLIPAKSEPRLAPTPQPVKSEPRLDPAPKLVKSELRLDPAPKPVTSEPLVVPASNRTLIRKIEESNTKQHNQMNETARLVINSRVPLEVQRNLIALISKFEDGIWCAELPEAYQTLHKKELNYAKFGFKNLILMCMELEKIFYCYRPNKADFILYDRIKPLPNDFETHFMQPSDCKMKPTRVETVMNKTSKLLYPLNVLHLFDVVPKQFTSCDIKKDDFIEVCVAEIYNPGQFFVILTKNAAELDELMDGMQVFYSKREKEFQIPQYMLSENLFCVTLYDNEYHRARVLEVHLQAQTVKVFCFDYGSIDVVDLSNLYYLHKRFAGFPQQAIEAKLAAIEPISLSDAWSQKASLQFLQVTRDKDLIAHIYNVDRVRQQLDMFLVDSSGGKDVYITDQLVDNGFAVFKHRTDNIKKVVESDNQNKNKSFGRKALLQKLKVLYATTKS